MQFGRNMLDSTKKCRYKSQRLFSLQNALNIPSSLYFSRQQAIGLHRYKTKMLLFELFYFTFLVVMTAVQVFIFHERYLKQFVWEVPDKASNSDDSSVRFTMHSETSNNSAQPIISESVRISS